MAEDWNNKGAGPREKLNYWKNCSRPSHWKEWEALDETDRIQQNGKLGSCVMDLVRHYSDLVFDPILIRMTQN